jgi:hypothetical protein
MAKYKPLIPKEKLDCSLMEKTFSGSPLDFYMLYDAIADELIIKIMKPDAPTSLYSVGDDVSFVVNLLNFKVVGIVFTNYQQKHLPQLKEIEKHWYKNDLPKHLRHYVKFRTSIKDEPNQDTYLTELFTQTTVELCKEFAYA